MTQDIGSAARRQSEGAEPGQTSQEVERDALRRQVYLLVADFLQSRGHRRLANDLLYSCRKQTLLPQSFNWEGQLLPSSATSAAGSRNAECAAGDKISNSDHSQSKVSDLEVLLRDMLFRRDSDASINGGGFSHSNPDLMALAKGLTLRVTPLLVSADCKLPEEYSPFRGGDWQSLLPWSIASPWADSILHFALGRFIHVRLLHFNTRSHVHRAIAQNHHRTSAAVVLCGV